MPARPLMPAELCVLSCTSEAGDPRMTAVIRLNGNGLAESWPAGEATSAHCGAHATRSSAIALPTSPIRVRDCIAHLPVPGKTWRMGLNSTLLQDSQVG